MSEKPKLTLLPLVEPAAGPESMLGATGATASTVQVRVTDELAFPEASSARNDTVCEPSLRAVYALGLVQDTNAAASSLHSKVAAPAVSEMAKLTFGPLVEAGAGPESMLGVGGAMASTVQVRLVADDVLP